MVLEFDIRNEGSQEKVWTFIYHPEVPVAVHLAMSQPGRSRSNREGSRPGGDWGAWAEQQQTGNEAGPGGAQ